MTFTLDGCYGHKNALDQVSHLAQNAIAMKPGENCKAMSIHSRVFQNKKKKFMSCPHKQYFGHSKATVPVAGAGQSLC